MPPVLIPKVHEMVLPDVGPVSVPIGEPIAHLKCFEAVVLIPRRQPRSVKPTPYFFRPTHNASGTSEKPSVSPTSHLITDFQIRSTTYEFSMLPAHSCYTKNKPVILSSPEADQESQRRTRHSAKRRVRQPPPQRCGCADPRPQQSSRGTSAPYCEKV